MNVNYTLNIPNPPNNPSQDVPNMQTNTNSIPTLIGVDHYGFGNNLGGYHKQVHLVNESAPGIGSASGVLYSNVASGQSVPFWQNASGSFPILGGPSVFAVNGYTTLPNGLIIQWGSVTSAFSTSGSTTGNVSFNIPFPTAIFYVSPTLFGYSGSSQTLQVLTGSATTSQFTWRFTTAPNSTSYTGFNWLAIGR